MWQFSPIPYDDIHCYIYLLNKYYILLYKIFQMKSYKVKYFHSISLEKYIIDIFDHWLQTVSGVLCLLVFLQTCHFLTATPTSDATIRVCGPKLNRMISVVCNNHFQTIGKKRSESIFNDYGSLNEEEDLSQWLDHNYFRMPTHNNALASPSKFRFPNRLPSSYMPPFSSDDSSLETVLDGTMHHQRIRRDSDYVVLGGLATECCRKACTYDTMLQFCGQ